MESLHNNERQPNGRRSEVEPFTVDIPDAQRFSGLSRSELYRRLAAGDIKALKVGSRTLILVESLRQYLVSRPAATFRSYKGNL